MSHRARADEHDQGWRLLPPEERTFEQERWLKEEKKALDRLHFQHIVTTCPVCNVELIGNEYAAVAGKGDVAAMVHRDCVNGARVEGWRIALDPAPVTRYTR